ncbi:acetyl-CoA synthetase-like protein [Jaminaea rosea]|uniref:Acetyl-CoA synthetase-like protein n=1 Tax=Jaminaea rosea TaxID=1569628 RepID=A0A316UWK3_9BASI|nr:acetyl-CoA synthetase-like protein [Jaminaea rosea]PWN28303.1 acetyl-CoA synthetase-like protein [Jaminaea rosea]
MAPPKSASVEVGDAPPKGEGRIRRSYKAPDNLIANPGNGIETMVDVFNFALKKFTNKPVLGWRDLVKMHEEEKEVTKKVDGKEKKEMKKWQYFELSDYKYLTYAELDEKIAHVSSGLSNLGLSKETRFNIYSATSLNWQLLAHSCFRQNIPFCTAYETLGEEGLSHSLNEPEVVGVFTNENLIDTLANVLPETKTVKYVIYDGKPSDEKIKKLEKGLEGREGTKVISLHNLLEEGKKNKAEAHPPKSEDVACIMYTSGSTGAPKGVILTHANLVSSVGGVVELLGEHLLATDTFLAYLPLAHILEFVVECSLIFVGVTMGYGSVKTLTDQSVRNCQGDLVAFKPSVMVGVPAVWEQIRKGINAKLSAAPTIARGMFNAGLTVKRNKIPGLSGFFDAVVFKKVAAATGGRLRLALSGGAAISRETQEFLDLALVQLLQGYGMTESSAMCAIVTPQFHKDYGTVGVPVPSIEIKLKDVPDAGYFSTNNPPQGEVLIRGPAVTKGYFKREETTKETIDDQGWLMTGDVGQWNKDGTLSIIDRKKNLVKLAGGEYIAIEKIESALKSSSVVQNMALVASSDAKQPMAVVFPREGDLQKLAGNSEDLSTLIKDKQLANKVKDELVSVGKKNGHKGMELVQCVLLVGEELPMTAAQKLQRKQVEDKYKDSIKEIYP